MADEYSFSYDNYLRNQFKDDFTILLRTAQGRFYFYFQGNPQGYLKDRYFGTRLADGPYNNTTHMRVGNRESNGGDTPVYLTKKQLKEQIITRRKQIQDIRREIEGNRRIFQGRNEQFLQEELSKLEKEKEMLERDLSDREEEDEYFKNNLSPGFTAVDSFDDFEDEKSDIPEQMFVIPPGYRVLFATGVDNYFVNKNDYRGNPIINLTVNKFMYHVGQEVEAIKFCHIGKNNYSEDEEDVVKRFMVRPDLALYPVLDVKYWGNKRRLTGEDKIVTHVQKCLEKIKMLRRKIESIVWVPFNDMRNNNRFTQNVKTMCNRNNKKFSTDHYFANRDNRMIWLGDGICSGKLGLLYYWEPVLGTTKFVLKSLNTRIGKDRGNAYYYEHMIMIENLIYLINVNIQILMGSFSDDVINRFGTPGTSRRVIMQQFMNNNDLIFRDIGWDKSEKRFNSERRGLLQDLKYRFMEIGRRKRGRNGNRNDYRYNKRSRNRMLKM